MRKEVATAVIASVTTAGLLWLFTQFGRIPNIVSVPTGAVVGFDLEKCPDEGWREYKPGYGRFIRGVDKSGTKIDPAGERVAGSFQEDAFGSHSHQERPLTGTLWLQRYRPDQGTWGSEKDGNRLGPRTGDSGGEETRPKNVALLLCEKI